MTQNFNSTFKNQVVRIDNQVFVDCVFEDCEMIYGGSSSFTLNGCNFYNCKWAFDGAAANTVSFMRLVYHNLKNDGEQLVNEIFNTIKSVPIKSEKE